MRVIFLLTLLLLGQSSVSAQKTMEDLIKTIPQEILPYMNESQRNEINQFVGLKDTVKVKNMLEGTLSIDSISKNFAKITLNDAVNLQIRLFSKKDSSQIICMIKTVNKPVKESHVYFYSTSWEKMEQNFGLPDYTEINETLLASFLNKPTEMTVEKFKELSNSIEPIIVFADFSKQSEIITFQLSLSLMSKEQKNEIKAITKQNSFKWDGFIFKKC